MKLYAVMKKNFKNIIRSKGSAVIILLGPLLVMIFMITAFNNASAYNLILGVYSESYSDLSTSFVETLNQSYRTIKYNSSEQCIEDIKAAAVHTCIVFPKDMGLENNVLNEITFYADFSKTNLVWTVIEVVSANIEKRSGEISKDLTSYVVDSLLSTDSLLKDGQPLISATTRNLSVVKTNTNRLKSDLNSLDISIKVEDFRMVEMKNATAEARNQLNETTMMLQNVTVFLDAAKVLLADINLSGSKGSELNELVDHSKLLVANATYLLHCNMTGNHTANSSNNITDNNTGCYRSMNRTIGELDAYIDQASNSLSTLSSRIQAMSSFRTDANAKLQDTLATIDSSRKHLESVEETVEDIRENIASIEVTNVENIVNPVTTALQPVVAYTTHLNYIFPSLLVFVIMFVAILLGTTNVQMEKTSKAYFRNYISSINDSLFTLGAYLTIMIVLIVQLAVILGISSYFFGDQIVPVLLECSVVLLLVATCFTLIGMLIGNLFDSEEMAMLAAISTESLFLLISSLILPLESMPLYFSNLAKLNPFYIGDYMLRRIILFRATLTDMLSSMLMLALYSLLALFMIYSWQRFDRRNFYIRWMRDSWRGMVTSIRKRFGKR